MPKTKKKKRKKPSKKVYFGPEVEEAILKYNKLDSEYEKEKLYNDLIFPALNKLCEIIINGGVKGRKFEHKQLSFEELKFNGVTYLTNRLHKIDEDSGKAYSYFTIASYHYFIRKCKASYEHHISKRELDVLDYERDVQLEKSRKEYKEMLKTFIYTWCNFLEKHANDLFNSKRDKMILDALIDIFRTAEDIDIFNKKLIYVLIKERGVGIKTQNITKVVNRLKEMYYEQFKQYQNTGKFEIEKYI